MFVSVIIPTRNSEKYIGEAIESVVAQTYQHLDIIIVDDGSIDNTKEIIKKFIKSYPDKITFTSQKNLGPSSARNKGIVCSKGEYIAFLDSDDIWLKEKLELQIKALNLSKAGLVYTDYYVEELLTGANSINHCVTFSRNKFKELFLLQNPVFTSTVLVKRECLKKVGSFDESLHVAEDWDLWLRLFKEYDFVRVPVPLVRQRVRKNSQSSEPEKNLSNDLLFLSKIFSECGTDIKKNQRSKAYSYRYYSAAIAYKDSKKRLEAAKYFYKAFCLFPFGLLKKPYLGLLLWIVLGDRIFLKVCTKIQNILAK